SPGKWWRGSQPGPAGATYSADGRRASQPTAGAAGVKNGLIRVQPDLAQDLLGRGAGEVLPSRFEDQFMRQRSIELLLLQQHPAPLIDEQAQRMFQRLEAFLAPAMVAGMPEGGDHERLVGRRVRRRGRTAAYHHGVRPAGPSDRRTRGV